MWLYIIGLGLLIVGVVGSIVSGGIFTVVLVPLGVVALVTAGIVSLWLRSQQGREGGGPEASTSVDQPLPTGHSNATAAPNSPEQLVDARREQQ
jgi:hypothetical protein